MEGIKPSGFRRNRTAFCNFEVALYESKMSSRLKDRKPENINKKVNKNYVY